MYYFPHPEPVEGCKRISLDKLGMRCRLHHVSFIFLKLLIEFELTLRIIKLG